MFKLISLLTLILLCGAMTLSLWADSDEYRGRDNYLKGGNTRNFSDEHNPGKAAYLSDPGYATYRSECGDCHMVYPPDLLPATSRQDMLQSLDDHYGDNAELGETSFTMIHQFLTNHAATSVGGNKYSVKQWRSIKGLAPPSRITETAYFRGKHHEIDPTMVRSNAEIGSFSRCDACHSNAYRGVFDEDQVFIPGYGRWDD